MNPQKYQSPLGHFAGAGGLVEQMAGTTAAPADDETPPACDVCGQHPMVRRNGAWRCGRCGNAMGLSAKVDAARLAIAAGTYETPAKLNAATDAMLDTVCPPLPTTYLILHRDDGSAYVTTTAREHKPYDPPPTRWTRHAAELVLAHRDPDRLPARTIPTPSEYAKAMVDAARPDTLPLFGGEAGGAA